MKKQSTFVIEDEESLKQWIEKDNMLLIFDVHLHWTGSCEVLTPCFDQTYVQHERAEERLVFLTMEGPKFADQFESMVTFSESCVMTLDDLIPIDNSSKDTPTTNDNANANDIGERLKMLLRKEDKGCAPLFLAVKGKKIVSIILGANYPSLLKVVSDQMPPLPGDEIEKSLID
jgi:hypothetical protein